MLKRSSSKRITIDGHRYRYVVSEVEVDEGNAIPISIVVQHDLSNGSRLLVRGLTTRRDPDARAKNYMGRAVGRPIRPRDVAHVIRLAIKGGWEPTTSVPPFTFHVANSELYKTNGVA